MEIPILNLTDTILGVNWDNSVKSDKLITLKEEFKSLLDSLSNQYNLKLSVENKNEICFVRLPESFSSLNLYVTVLTKIIEFLNSRDIIWCYGSLSFNFLLSNKSGLVDINKDKGHIKIYYLKDSEINKLKVPMKGVAKLN